MTQSRRSPAAANGRALGTHRIANFGEPENTEIQTNFQCLGEVVEQIIDRIARRHELSKHRARLVVDEAGLAMGAR